MNTNGESHSPNDEARKVGIVGAVLPHSVSPEQEVIAHVDRRATG
jgi:hypothetical protein